MEPYLEEPSIWYDFHHTLAVCISRQLNSLLPEQYYAQIMVRKEIGLTDLSQFHPDDELHSHLYVVVRDLNDNHKVVTAIEIVSPSNKVPGPDRQAYEHNRDEILGNGANLVEIDLLRTGIRLLPYQDLRRTVAELAPDYLVLVNRASGRRSSGRDYELYPIELASALPSILVPIGEGDADIPLNLQALMDRLYNSGPYRRMGLYSEPTDPPLTEAQAAWADEVLRKAGLRP
jgi:hypothetical protein